MLSYQLRLSHNLVLRRIRRIILPLEYHQERMVIKAQVRIVSTPLQAVLGHIHHLTTMDLRLRRIPLHRCLELYPELVHNQLLPANVRLVSTGCHHHTAKPGGAWLMEEHMYQAVLLHPIQVEQQPAVLLPQKVIIVAANLMIQ